MKKGLAALLCAMTLLNFSKTYAEFCDLDGNKNKDIINYLYERGIVSGVSDGYYVPEKCITRAEFSKMVCLAMGYDNEEWTNNFTDVDNDAWYTSYVNILAKKKIINGYENLFRPNDNITNEEAAKLLVCLYESETSGLRYQGTYASFMSDYFDISPWAREYVNKGVMIGAVRSLEYPVDITNINLNERTKVSEYKPKEGLRRDECAEIVYNVMNAISNTKNNEEVGI